MKLTPSARRIALALLLSLLVHAALMWLPDIRLPRNDILPPPLIAKLEPLPRVATPPKPPQRKPAPKPAAPVKTVETAPESVPGAVSEVASAVAAAPVASAVEAAPAGGKPPHPLPRHARVTYAVYKGTGGFKVGEVRSTLTIEGDAYELKSFMETTGLVRVFKTYERIQISRGHADAHGLRPGRYEDMKNNSGDVEKTLAVFDWNAQTLHLDGGRDVPLPEGAQDLLSIFYNTSQLPLDGDSVTLKVSNGKKLETYDLAIGAVEEIETPLGKIHALHLTKRRAPDESGFEIWLGLEYRLFPVKYLILDSSGDVQGTVLASDIRASDE